MQQIKENKATKKTKTELANALKGLMRSKPFNKITVSELVEKANINRKTFYYHFDNIYSLLKWMFDEEAVLIFKDMTLLDNYEEAILFALDYVTKNEAVIRCAHKALSGDAMKKLFYKEFFEIVMQVLKKTEAEKNVKFSANYENFIARFYTGAIIEILIDWITTEDKSSPQSFASNSTKIIRASLNSIINENKNDKFYASV